MGLPEARGPQCEITGPASRKQAAVDVGATTTIQGPFDVSGDLACYRRPTPAPESRSG
jgi:hypothetical protein